MLATSNNVDCYTAILQSGLDSSQMISETLIFANYPQKIRLRQVCLWGLTENIAELGRTINSVAIVLVRENETGGSIKAVPSVGSTDDFAEPCSQVIWSHQYLLGPTAITVINDHPAGVGESTVPNAPQAWHFYKDNLIGDIIYLQKGDEIRCVGISNSLLKNLLLVQHVWDIKQ